MARILITGGAGFVGSSLARAFKADGHDVVTFDNLRRRGSEINLATFKTMGIRFVHGDIRQMGDLEDLDGNFDLLVEASAEPSVLAGLSGGTRYLLDTNLYGTLNCLELAKKRVGATVFLSTSRVYSIGALRAVPLKEGATRLEISDPKVAGLSTHGIAEEFAVNEARSLYGATKLASEMFVQEYVAAFGMKAVINRCGVIAGPGQFGKVDQGVFTMWVANHQFGQGLKYIGFGGTGKQVRDLLHPADLFDLVQKEWSNIDKLTGQTFNAGGGHSGSVSLLELTALCQKATGKEVPIASVKETTSVDIPYYVSDNRRVEAALGWRPKKTPGDIVHDIQKWLTANEAQLRPLFV